MQKKLTAEERATLKIIANRDQDNVPPREHLEKLSRLDLIEPCPEGVCMTELGRNVVKKK